MSVICLDIKVFQAVENKIQSFANCNYIDKEHNCDTARKVFNIQGFSGNDIYCLDKLSEVVYKWIEKAVWYNNSAYRGRYGASDGWQAYTSGETKKITLIQCYKFLQCIMYNSDIDSYMEPAIYEAEYKAEYEAWRNTGRALLTFMASHIVTRSDEYEAANWASL